MPKIIVYPGTFDPIHNGHIDLIKRISQQYDKVIVAVAKETGDKHPSLDFLDRIELASIAIKELGLNNVEVRGFVGSLVERVRFEESNTILRGVRDAKDIAFESVISNVTRSPFVSGFFEPPLEVICLISDPKYKDISSTKIREMATRHEDVSDLAPLHVAKKMRAINFTIADKSGGSSLDWKYLSANYAINFWNKHKKTATVAAVSFAAGASLRIFYG